MRNVDLKNNHSLILKTEKLRLRKSWCNTRQSFINRSGQKKNMREDKLGEFNISLHFETKYQPIKSARSTMLCVLEDFK